MTLPSLGLFLFFSLLPAAGGGGAPPTSAPAPAATADAGAARIDALHARRDDARVLAEERAFVDEQVKRTPRDYEVLWRAARLYFWMGDDPSLSATDRSRLGKTGWGFAEAAITIRPDRPEGYYWAAVNIGTYAMGLGAVRALASGLEGQFRERLSHAEALAPGYNHGGVGVAWGRFFEKLPWPKRDRGKAELALRRVLEKFPDNLRARVFLADTLAQTGRAAEAKRLLDEVAAAPLGRYDTPEERRAKALGDGLRPAIMKMLK